MESHS